MSKHLHPLVCLLSECCLSSIEQSNNKVMTMNVKPDAAVNVRFGLSRAIQVLSISAILSCGIFQAPVSYGQGAYYPVFPEGSPYGMTYTGTPILQVADLSFLETELVAVTGNPALTLQIPVPTLSSAPTTADLTAAVLSATQKIIAGTAPSGVTLQTFSREVVAYKPVDLNATVGAIAQAIVGSGNTSAIKITDLTTVTDTLAKAQPQLIDSIIQPILAQARTVAAVANGIPIITKTAIEAIPRDAVRVSSIVGTGLNNIILANLSAAAKTALYTSPTTGYIATLLGSGVVDNNPALIDVAVKRFTEANSLSLATLDQVLTAASAGLVTKSTATVGALTAGALRSQGGLAAGIKSRLATELVATPALAAFSGEFVDGYTSGTTLVALNVELSGNANADAVAGGATVRGTLAPAVIVKAALQAEQATAGASVTTAREVVRAVVAGNLDAAVSVVTGAIRTGADPSPYTPWGDGTFADIASGAVAAARIESAGALTLTVIQKSSATVTTLSISVVQSVVNAAIVAASGNGKSGAFADIVYKAQSISQSTPGMSDPLVRQAIQSISAVAGGASAPHYIAVVAALAGANGANRQAIRDAAFLIGTGEVYLQGGDVLAATNGANLIRDIFLPANIERGYRLTLAAMANAQAQTNPGSVPTTGAQASVLAGLYAAILTNPNQSSASLAAAIKQSTGISTVTLTNAAVDAIRGLNGLREANLRLVGEVATYARQNSLTGTTDVLDYVGRQVLANPTLTNDVATAWTVVDPNHAHYVSHAVAFNNPTAASATVRSVFLYTQITSPTPFIQPTLGNPSGAVGAKAYLSGTKGTIIDQPAAAAAITAGYVTGILEANLSPAAERSAIIATVSTAVSAAVVQENALLKGPALPFNFGGDSNGNTIADNLEGFRQSNGNGGLVSGARTVGAAGAITGYIAQTTKLGDTSIVKAGETASNAGSVAFAVLQASVLGNVRPYALEIAQAAAQALRWVGGASVSANAAQAAADIANAIAPNVVGVYSLAQLTTAALFGITEAANGTIGAGALGLNAQGLDNGTITVRASGNNNSDFYVHRTATGAPVTDIFNL